MAKPGTRPHLPLRPTVMLFNAKTLKIALVLYLLT